MRASFTRDFALRAGLCVAVALTGIAAAYVLSEFWPRDARQPQPDPSTSAEPVEDDPPLPDNDPPTPGQTTKSLPPLRTHDLPPPAQALLSGTPLPTHSMAPSTSFGTSSEEAPNEEDPQSNLSDTDSFVDLLSPHPAHALSRRRSMRSHDLFAASHISFSELGNLVTPENERAN